MAAKKPLLPPGSRWNTLERSSARNKVEDSQPQNNGNEGARKLITSVSTNELMSLGDDNSHRKPPRSSSDDLLSHDKVHSGKPLPPTPPPTNKFRVVDGTNVDSTKPSISQRSRTTFVKPPPPPYRERNSPPVPNKSSKPPIVPRKIYPPTDEVNSQGKRPKPPLPRKPRTVHVIGHGGPAPVPLRKPNIGKPLELSGLLQKSDVHRQPLSPNRETQSKAIVNEINKSKPSLEKMLLSKSVDVGSASAVKDIECNDRPASMILPSQVLCPC